MGGYTFRLAGQEDEAAIVAFMRTHWGSRHPLIELPDFFAYYYKTNLPHLNFALCEQDGQLAALAGFIVTSCAENPDVWVSLWIADKAAQGSGLELMAAMPQLTGCKTLACNNIRPKTRAFYEFLGYATGRMGHFYRLGTQPQLKLARIAEPQRLPVGGQAVLKRLHHAEELRASGFVPPQQANPYKDLWYIERRYFAYPRQTYEVYAAQLPGKADPQALLCTRTVPVNGTAVLRIADYIGQPAFLPELGAAIDGLIAQKQAEYADFYCAGISASLMAQAGFTEREEGSEDIVPNYLTPPLYENTDYYYFTSRSEGFVMCKADGDQDRPNIPLDEA